ncbi:MAG: hypothetical protein AMXMBFR31_23450 [Candidatus Desulfobacillus denitrificans]
MGMMEEIRERARAEAELLPPSLALLKSMEKQVCDLHKKLNSAMEQIEVQREQLNKLLKMTNAIGLLVKKLQPHKEKRKWTFWTF